jgi:hypothetical protein
LHALAEMCGLKWLSLAEQLAALRFGPASFSPPDAPERHHEYDDDEREAEQKTQSEKVDGA